MTTAPQPLLERATPDGKKLASTFLRLIDLLDAAHYGVVLVPPGKAKDAVKWAAQLVARANEELERRLPAAVWDRSYGGRCHRRRHHWR